MRPRLTTPRSLSSSSGSAICIATPASTRVRVLRRLPVADELSSPDHDSVTTANAHAPVTTLVLGPDCVIVLPGWLIALAETHRDGVLVADDRVCGRSRSTDGPNHAHPTAALQLRAHARPDRRRRRHPAHHRAAGRRARAYRPPCCATDATDHFCDAEATMRFASIKIGDYAARRHFLRPGRARGIAGIVMA
jgi:hypothetical protein